jgi:hypothetical protein
LRAGQLSYHDCRHCVKQILIFISGLVFEDTIYFKNLEYLIPDAGIRHRASGGWHPESGNLESSALVIFYWAHGVYFIAKRLRRSRHDGLFTTSSLDSRYRNPFTPCLDKFDAGTRNHNHCHGDLVFYGQGRSGLYGNNLRNAIP